MKFPYINKHLCYPILVQLYKLYLNISKTSYPCICTRLFPWPRGLVDWCCGEGSWWYESLVVDVEPGVRFASPLQNCHSRMALLWSYEKGFPCMSFRSHYHSLCPSWEEHPKSPWTLRRDPTEWSTALRSNGSLPLIGAVRLPCPQRQSGECKAKTRGGKVGQTDRIKWNPRTLELKTQS